MSLVDRVKRRFARPPEPVRVAVLASADPDERVLAWGALAGEGGWLVATSRGLRVVPPEVTSVQEAGALDPRADVEALDPRADVEALDPRADVEALDPRADVEMLRWHEIAEARWSATSDGGGSFVVTPLVEVEPGVQARQPQHRYVLTDAGELPATVRRRVDQTIVASQRSPLPGGGGVLLVARRIPGQPVREWTVVFDDDGRRSDPEAREVARRKLAELVAADQPD